MSDRPRTRYAKSGDVHIAYQVIGEGRFDLVLVPGFVSHVEHIWEEPSAARYLHRLTSFSRLVLFDKRGTGLSDRVESIPTLEQRMDDVRAVMDAAAVERAALLGVSEGGPMSLLFTATYPARSSALILYGTYARRLWAPDHPFGPTEDQVQARLAMFEAKWGEPVGIETTCPSMANDNRYREWWASLLRFGASPGAAVTLMRMATEIDVRHVLPAIRVPTLVLHRTGEQFIRVENARYLGEKIAGAKLVELPGVDHHPWVGDADSVLDEIEEFLTGVRHGPEPDRVLATILFTDIVGSSEKASEIGDSRWGDLLQSYYSLVRRELARFRGKEIDTAGDGMFATFDGPARAIRCALGIETAVHQLGIEVRAGLHTGECEVIGEKVSGIAVHIGARVVALARAGEVLVSNTVKDLVAGSGITFENRGTHVLRGIPGEWPLFAAASSTTR